ncbi:MAG: GNAT family N-acetyltransferase [Rhodothermales bacterium]
MPSTFTVHRHSDAQAFSRRAESWLLRAEAEHNLILGLSQRLARSEAEHEPLIYLATIEDRDEVVGCAFRTPPFKLVLTRMPVQALPALVDDVGHVYTSIPAVMGPEQAAQRFAERWSKRHGVTARLGMQQRIYQLRAVTLPRLLPPGRLRKATLDDLDLAADWIAAFSAEAGAMGAAARQQAENHIAQQSLFFWETDVPVSMAGWSGRTPNGVRVGPVYTPPEHRRRGYAAASVVALSPHLLNTGSRFCFLYTDLANATSNGIYQRLGYQPVCDVVDYDFERLDVRP